MDDSKNQTGNARLLNMPGRRDQMLRTMLPLAAKKLGADPAIMATPFITTIVDACSLILYFQIAQAVFRGMM